MSHKDEENTVLLAIGAVLLILAHLQVLVVVWVAAFNGGMSDEVSVASAVTWGVVGGFGLFTLMAGTGL